MSVQDSIAAALNAAIGLNPEIAAYNTNENGEVIGKYILENWGVGGMESTSAWEIAFAAVKDQLKPIPNFLAPLDQATCDRLTNMVGSEVRVKYQRDPEFRKLWDRFSATKRSIEAETSDPYANLTSTQWRSIPAAENAKLYATNPQYRAAVDRLMNSGSI